MGADFEFSQKQAEEAFEHISYFLLKKYNMDIAKECTFGYSSTVKDFNENREQFREALFKLFWDDACNSF